MGTTRLCGALGSQRGTLMGARPVLTSLEEAGDTLKKGGLVENVTAAWAAFVKVAPFLLVLQALLLFVLFIATVWRRSSVQRLFGMAPGRPRFVKIFLSNLHLKDVPEARIAVQPFKGSPVRRGYSGDTLSVPDVEAMLTLRKAFEALPSALEALIEFVPSDRLQQAFRGIAQKILAIETAFEPSPATEPRPTDCDAILIGSSVYNSLTAMYMRACGYEFSFHPSIVDPFAATARGEEPLSGSIGNIRWINLIGSDGRSHPVEYDRMNNGYLYDIGVVAKLRFESYTVVICAGNDAQSTKGCTRYLKENLKALAEDNRDNSFVRILGFAVDQDQLRKGIKSVDTRFSGWTLSTVGIDEIQMRRAIQELSS